jgi:hypothetical protein
MIGPRLRNVILAGLAAVSLFSSVAVSLAQPAPVPALPDTERRTSYSISGSTCSCAVNFALYGDSTDFSNWLEVWVNGVQQFGTWTLTSPSGSLANLPRPITDAIITFVTAQTGTVQIVGARRPRRAVQFSEGGVTARSLNQALTDIIAQNRENWDKTNDVTGRAILAPPGETLKMLPVLASRQNMGACFDSNGNLSSCVAASGSFIAGTGITFTGTNPTTIAATASIGGVAGPITLDPTLALSGSVLKLGNYTASGGTARTITSKIGEIISVTDYGAVCNGSIDDTAAIAAAFTAAASSKVIFPPGVNCKVKGSGSYVFNISAPIIIDCQGAQIVLDATVPNTRGMFLFAPTGAGDRLPSRQLTRCLLNMNGTGAATITIDTTATNTTEIGEFEIDHVRDSASGTSTGTNASIFVNNIGTNTNGGTFNVNFHDNVLSNGIYLNSAGDSIRIKDSILSGAKYGVYASLITGAGGLLITGNNISAATPLLIDAASGNTVVKDNEFEQQITNTDPSNAVVDFRGGSGTLTLLTFTGNSINALAGTGSPNPLKIANVSQAYVESNSFISGVAGPACIVNSGGGTIIGASNSYAGCATHVSNSGTLKYVQVGVSP